MKRDGGRYIKMKRKAREACKSDTSYNIIETFPHLMNEIYNEMEDWKEDSGEKVADWARKHLALYAALAFEALKDDEEWIFWRISRKKDRLSGSFVLVDFDSRQSFCAFCFQKASTFQKAS